MQPPHIYSHISTLLMPFDRTLKSTYWKPTLCAMGGVSTTVIVCGKETKNAVVLDQRVCVCVCVRAHTCACMSVLCGR